MDIKDIHKGDLALMENSDLHGILNGNVVVKKGFVFDVHGIINGNVTCNENSVLNLYGILKGNISADKAKINIFGVLKGNVMSNDCLIDVSQNAIIVGSIIKKENEAL